MQFTLDWFREEEGILSTCLARTTQLSKGALYPPHRGNKEKVRQKKGTFSNASGYCYPAAAKEFEISFCQYLCA